MYILVNILFINKWINRKMYISLFYLAEQRRFIMNCLAQLLQLTDDLSHPVSSDFSPLLFLLFTNGPEATVRTRERERDRIMKQFDFELASVQVPFTNSKSLCKEIRFSLPTLLFVYFTYASV